MMASSLAEVGIRSFSRLPQHLFGSLVARCSPDAPKFPSRKSYFVLQGESLCCYDNKEGYEKANKVKQQINLDQVSSISEMVILKKKADCCIKLVLHTGAEIDLLAESSEEVRQWVRGLQQAKEVWTDHKKRQQALAIEEEKQKEKQQAKTEPKNGCYESAEECYNSSLVKVKISTCSNMSYHVRVPRDCHVHDLVTCATEGMPCIHCPTCQLRRKMMEVWTVDSNGQAQKLSMDDQIDATGSNDHFFLLEHSYRLLVVHFENGTFAARPADTSLQAKDVPQMFASELSDSVLEDFQLYLEYPTKTVRPFAKDEKPLFCFWESKNGGWFRVNQPGERLLLKRRALQAMDNIKVKQKTVQESRISKAIQDRRNQNALKQIENQTCKQRGICSIPQQLKYPSTSWGTSVDTTPVLIEDGSNAPNELRTSTVTTIQNGMMSTSGERETRGQLSVPFCPLEDFTELPGWCIVDKEGKDIEKSAISNEVHRTLPRDVESKTNGNENSNRAEQTNEGVQVVNNSGKVSSSLKRKGGMIRRSSRLSESDGTTKEFNSDRRISKSLGRRRSSSKDCSISPEAGEREKREGALPEFTGKTFEHTDDTTSSPLHPLHHSKHAGDRTGRMHAKPDHEICQLTLQTGLVSMEEKNKLNRNDNQEPPHEELIERRKYIGSDESCCGGPENKMNESLVCEGATLQNHVVDSENSNKADGDNFGGDSGPTDDLRVQQTPIVQDSNTAISMQSRVDEMKEQVNMGEAARENQTMVGDSKGNGEFSAGARGKHKSALRNSNTQMSIQRGVDEIEEHVKMGDIAPEKQSMIDDSTGEGDNHVNVSSTSQSTDTDSCAVLSSNILTRKTDEHTCQYYPIRTPYMLKNVLTQYAKLRQGEEEIGTVLPPCAICIAGIHIIRRNNRWNVLNIAEISNQDIENSSEYEYFALDDKIAVHYHKTNRQWFVQMRGKAEEAPEIPDDLESNEHACETYDEEHNQTNKTSEKDVEDECARIEGKGSCDVIALEDAVASEQPLLTDTRKSPLALPSPKSLYQRADSTKVRSAFPFKAPPRSILNMGQGFGPIDDSFPGATEESLEVRMLEDATQKVFYHLERRNVLPVNGLDDKQYPVVRTLVCTGLCDALVAILSSGTKKRWTLKGYTCYTPWEVTKGLCVSSRFRPVLQRIKELGVLSDQTRFVLFVCECLSHGEDLLAVWVEELQRDKKRLVEFYEESAIIMKTQQTTELEAVLSRLSYLPFQLSYCAEIRRQILASEQSAFTFE